MAKVIVSSQRRVFPIKQWLGLNESPDGDTGLKNGEAAVMRNFRVTREGHLQIRPGYGPVCTLCRGKRVRGLWRGYVAGKERLVAACGGKLWSIDPAEWSAAAAGTIADEETFFFGFSQKLYILTGKEYYCWDGSGQAKPVEGYIPLVMTAAAPEGAGTVLERVNLLNGKRRERFSPDGVSTEFCLVESEIDEVLAVEGTDRSWSVDRKAGKVRFSSPPETGTNTVTITWRKGTGEREKVTGMRFAELFNGAADSRVFLYGNGTNETVYSDLDDTGTPNAEYFPELNVIAVDSANTPITAMIRHYDRLIVFKEDSAYAAQYSTLALADGARTAAFFTQAVNREVGCVTPGGAQLVRNDPRTLYGAGVYQWSLAVNASRDERNARRLSDRVKATLGQFELKSAECFDDGEEQEYYVICGDRALVHNYGTDAWYLYTNVPMCHPVKVNGTLYFGTPEGQVMEFSRRYRNDALEPIDAYWESGAMAFEREWLRKYGAEIWAGVKPEIQTVVYMTAQSNVRSEHPRKVIASGIASFTHVSFAHWSFGTNRKPQIVRTRLKVKKAAFYKLILSSYSASATATILSVDVAVRYGGRVR